MSSPPPPPSTPPPASTPTPTPPPISPLETTANEDNAFVASSTTADTTSPTITTLATHSDDPDPDTDTPTNDPPPPYPSRERRRRRTRTEDPSFSLTPAPPATQYGDEEEATETTPFLSPTRRLGRPRAYSHTSTMSAAPSLARTVLSLFDTTADPEGDVDHTSDTSHHNNEDDPCSVSEEQRERERAPLALLRHGDEDDLSEYDSLINSRRSKGGLLHASTWRRYFRPLARAPYYRALFHLLVLNFPYALIAWVYLFVFTVTGTTLLVALPLGAVLCFFNLLGARAFARGELALQTKFHSPLAYPPPSPPRPIFTRLREPTVEEIEARVRMPGEMVWEKSFYKNTYAMFTDPTSYQSLFYFLIIKPSITIIFSLLLLVIFVPAMVFVLPAPAMLRAVRRLGAWQANVAIEGLYLAVR